MSDLPAVVVLGGTGFVGRNFVTYLVKNNLAGKVRVIDKVLPAVANLTPAQSEAFSNPIVEFKQGNLANKASTEKAFASDDTKWKFVFNCAAETKYGLEPMVYETQVTGVAKVCAEAAIAHGCERFVHLSTAQVYKPNSKPSDETGKLDPWTALARASLTTDEQLGKISGLTYTILRPAIVYGSGDKTGLTPRMSIAMAYKQLKETMKFLWTSDLKINTVHVKDVAAAMWHVCMHPSSSNGDIFNLCDSGNTDQGSLNKLLEKIFSIKTGFHGTILSKAAKAMGMQNIADEANEKHMRPFADACKSSNIVNTPLSTFLDKELLYDNHLCIDGTKITKSGFTYQHPKVTEDLLREVVDEYVAQQLFPPYK